MRVSEFKKEVKSKLLEAIRSILKTDSRYLLKEFGTYANFDIARTYFPLLRNSIVPKENQNNINDIDIFLEDDPQNNLENNPSNNLENNPQNNQKRNENRFQNHKYNKASFQRKHLGSLILYITLYYDQTASKPRKTLVDPNLSKFKELIHKIPFLFYPDDHEVEKIQHILNRFMIRNNLTFDLSFDPEFEEITHHEGYRHLFRTTGKEMLSSIYNGIVEDEFKKKEELMNNSINNLRFLLDFDPELEKPMEYEEVSKENKKFIDKGGFERNNKKRSKRRALRIENEMMFIDKLFITRVVESIGTMIFGDTEKVDQLFDDFIKYFSTKYEITADYTEKIISMFKFVMNEIECSISTKIKYSELKRTLEQSFSEHLVNTFLDRFIFDKQYNKVPKSVNKFKAKTMLHDYERFLGCLGYCQSGYIYTGVFTIWRAMLRFLDNIQKEREFYEWKGAELEKWCYKQAIKHDIECRKVIIQNEDQFLSKTYFEMKKQTADFPIKPIIINAPFLNGMNDSFAEFDLLLRVGDFIIALEAKTRRIPPGSRELPYLWHLWYEKVFLRHRFKTKLLKQLIDEHCFNDDFFKNVKKVIPMVVSTEGIITSSYGSDYKILPHLFEEWKKSIARGIIPKVKLSENKIKNLMENEEIQDFVVIKPLL